MPDKMVPYLGKFKPGDILVVKKGEDLEAVYNAFGDLPHKDVYWYPSSETVELLRGKPLTVESCYYFHGGYPIYVLVFENDGQEFEARICEPFLQKQGGSVKMSNSDMLCDGIDVSCKVSRITPTLFIALGGVGAEIALRLRSHILTHAWGYGDNRETIDTLDQFPLAQFIYYDLDSGTVGLDKFGDDEKMLSRLDLDKYLRTAGELNKYPLIDAWFPVTRKMVLDLGVDPFKGTGQLRWLSRLYFFDKYSHLKGMIDGKLGALLASVSSKRNTERLGLELEPASLHVVVIASTAGGTGSGSFLDVGYLTKWLAKKQLLRGAKVDLCLMLPGCFSGAGKSRVEANTYAALMELETCMQQGNQFVKGWSDHDINLDLPYTPYDDVFLFDNKNFSKNKTAKIADIYDMAADNLFEDFIPSDFSSRKRSIRVCHTQYKMDLFFPPVDVQKYGSLKLKYAKAYSAFGQSVINTDNLQRPDEAAGGESISTPLIPMLEAMSASERSSLFQNCLESAMPWVDANLMGAWNVNPDQYMCVVGVDGAALFAQKFGDEFRSAVPVRAGMPPSKINFSESGIPGKLTCYVELSGIPLTALSQLPKWRESYEEEGKRIPVHIHKDRSLFVHPLVPTSAELARHAEHFKLFIQGVALGVLQRSRHGGHVYCIECKGESFSIGNERLIRMDGLRDGHLNSLRSKIDDALEKTTTPVQLAGLAALYDFYAENVYPSAIVRNENGVDILQEGFGHVMCRKVAEEARNTLAEKLQYAGNELIVRQRNILENWTEEIEGSETDVYENEVGKGHVAKRRVTPEFFYQPGKSAETKTCSNCWEQMNVAAKFCGNCGNKFSEIPEPQPLLVQQLQVYVALNGQQAGPFDMASLKQLTRSGQLTRDSLVWMQGMNAWSAATAVPCIAALFCPVPPPLPPL